MAVTQVTLFAPDIFCEHCTMTIRETIETIEGARYLEGNHETRSFAVEVERGEVLDEIAEALATEGYPLGAATPLGTGAGDGSADSDAAFRPEYRVERSDAGAEVVYSCPCGSTTEVFQYDRAVAEQAPHSCCGHHVLVAPNAASELRDRLGDAYDYDVQTVEMPWGQSMEAVMAVPQR